ncbi:hypothetical protein WJX84_009505 [Apatococcus fuscideae]|uniref:MYND-type domain-containing protein n=1 Tax=Apatococcus fuscideae TaxID=2026836 RepID=A0AAW1T969_9CHLO
MAHGPWFAVFCRKGGVSCRLSGAEAGQKPCVTCGFRSPKSHCSLCKQVRYCGRNCQAADWKSHRIYCHSLAGQEYHQCFQPQVEHNSADRNKALTALFSAAELGKMCGDWMLESHALEDESRDDFQEGLDMLEASIDCFMHEQLELFKAINAYPGPGTARPGSIKSTQRHASPMHTRFSLVASPVPRRQRLGVAWEL